MGNELHEIGNRHNPLYVVRYPDSFQLWDNDWESRTSLSIEDAKEVYEMLGKWIEDNG